MLRYQGGQKQFLSPSFVQPVDIVKRKTSSIQRIQHKRPPNCPLHHDLYLSDINFAFIRTIYIKLIPEIEDFDLPSLVVWTFDHQVHLRRIHYVRGNKPDAGDHKNRQSGVRFCGNERYF